MERSDTEMKKSHNNCKFRNTCMGSKNPAYKVCKSWKQGKENIDPIYLMTNYIDKIVNKENAEKEYLCAAFIKETGLKPSQCKIVTQHTEKGFKIWIEKK